MNGVLGMAELLQDSPLQDRQRRHVDTIRQSGNGLPRIGNDILAFSKTEQGSVTVRVERDIANDACGMMNDELAARNEASDVHHSSFIVLRFSVTDNGIGLTAEQQGRRFQAFTQTDGSTTRK